MIFNRGCSAHHLGDGEFTGRIKTIPHSRDSTITVKKQIERECEHDGCDHIERTYEKMPDKNKYSRATKHILEEYLERMLDFDSHRELVLKEARAEMASREIETQDELEEYIEKNLE